jgi:hypothetical protein
VGNYLGRVRNVIIRTVVYNVDHEKNFFSSYPWKRGCNKTQLEVNLPLRFTFFHWPYVDLISLIDKPDSMDLISHLVKATRTTQLHLFLPQVYSIEIGGKNMSGKCP